MQEKIDRFKAAFVDMAADYVERLRLKIVQASVITVAEKRAGTARIDEPDWKIQLPDQVRIADCLAASVGRIEDRMERTRNADADKQPEDVADVERMAQMEPAHGFPLTVIPDEKKGTLTITKDGVTLGLGGVEAVVLAQIILDQTREAK